MQRMPNNNVLSAFTLYMIPKFCRLAFVFPAAVALLATLSGPAIAQSGQWQLVVVSATSAGWQETKGTATISPDFAQIYVKDKAGMSREVYRGEFKNNQWSGTRSVINTEKLGEPVNGQYAVTTIDRYRVETLILTSATASVNFIRTELVQ